MELLNNVTGITGLMARRYLSSTSVIRRAHLIILNLLVWLSAMTPLNKFQSLLYLNHSSLIKFLLIQGSDWHNSTSIPGFAWWGDTSSDEVTGHMFAYPVVYDLLAETEDEKERAYNLINNIMRYITSNGFLLIDVTGEV